MIVTRREIAGAVREAMIRGPLTRDGLAAADETARATRSSPRSPSCPAGAMRGSTSCGPRFPTCRSDPERAEAGSRQGGPAGPSRAAVVLAAAVAAAMRGDDVLASASATAATPAMQAALGAARRLLLQSPSPASVGRQLGNSSAGPGSVPAAIYAAAASESFSAAVSFAVRCGGDTDTIAAMAGAIAGARDGVAAIPSGWVDALENGERGRDHVLALADGLWERALAEAG